ncbi:hypothetical protein ACQCWA_04715 [Rossellomorea aquimaris]
MVQCTQPVHSLSAVSPPQRVDLSHPCLCNRHSVHVLCLQVEALCGLSPSQAENYLYGVSTPFVDALFGTLKDEKEVETSQTAKDLEKMA